MARSQNLNKSTFGVPQGEIRSPTLFEIYISEITLPQNDVQISASADDITITASHTNHHLKPNNWFNIFLQSIKRSHHTQLNMAQLYYLI